MKEAKAMAYVNMYGVLATLENLCQIDDEAKAVLRELKKPDRRPLLHIQLHPGWLQNERGHLRLHLQNEFCQPGEV